MSRRKGIMLCYPLEERRLSTWDTPYICQPKLDGVRCRAVPLPEGGYILLSSEENIIYHMDHIHSELSHLPRREYDGELYAHHLSFEEIVSRTSREVNPHPLRKEVEYHIFDIVDGQYQTERARELYTLSIAHASLEYIKFPSISLADSFDELWDYYIEYLKEGYEGIIVRHPFGLYHRARSTSIMKFKPKKSDSYLIVGYQEEVSIDGVPKGTLGSLLLTDPEGNEFSVGSGLTRENRTELWAKRDELIGKMAKIEYQHKTPRGVPRFPVFVTIERSEDEEE